MKIASIILRIVALLGAAFCVYAWLDTRGQISTAENHMKDLKGEDLVSKAGTVPGLLKNNSAMSNQIKTLQGLVSAKESDVNKLNSELEGERSKNVKTSSELAQKNVEIRTLNEPSAPTKRQLTEKDSLIETLKGEIVATKQMLTQNNEAEGLKEKVASLETQLETCMKELEEANKKAKLMEMAEVIEVIETDAAGNQIKRKIVKVPYVPVGDIATVISVDQKSKTVAINKGAAANIQVDQKILLKREGKNVTEIVVTEVYPEYSVGLMNRNFAIPETVELNDLLELCSPTVASPSVPAPAAPAETEAAAPAENGDV